MMPCCAVWWIVLKVKAAGSSETLVLPPYITSHPNYAVLFMMTDIPVFLNFLIVVFVCVCVCVYMCVCVFV